METYRLLEGQNSGRTRTHRHGMSGQRRLDLHRTCSGNKGNRPFYLASRALSADMIQEPPVEAR